MRLELGNIYVKDVQFGAKTEFKDGIVYVNKEELIKELQDERLSKIDVDIVRPGDSVRICPVKDVLEPRVKVSGNGQVFPGFFGNAEVVGSGRTHVLKGMTVLTVGKIVGFQEGIIDMTGPGADYTPFSKTINLVILADKVEGLKQHEHEAAVRMAGLKATRYIAEVARNVEPDEIKVYETKPLAQQLNEYPELPKVAYVYMLQSQGLMHDTYLYGVDAKQILPTFIYPTEVMDGAIISGNCVSSCDKNTTFHHMNNPIIYDLYERHGKDYNFVGVICTNENVTLLDKERSSNFTAKLVEFLGVDGVIISEEGFGNPDADLIMNCRKISALGVKTVCVTDEYAGRDGASQSLADSHPSADAVVSGGNANEVITLPKLDRVIGYIDAVNVIAGGFDGSLAEDGSITVEIQAITGATNELGYNKMGALGF
ncbi:glycine/sarcosine/betaine reductase component B subunit [Thermosyntropha sp.]|uniref:glycine/sarcosine/betaine reductase component B subunit n=1 Tax=Thermosyntropha sp. TaxID=2740820 RepID=UPI00260092ED|nr:glycine/sarcosine/betaine reductase component B subunit [Thermosyntropha sp.]MBO8159519.1 glycine/sarcosine/betaine reductase component B subunit [Thermosyntropha sp.]